MRQTALLVFLLLSAPAAAEERGTWLGAVPASLGNVQQWREVPKESFFEVSASKLPTAEAWLNDIPYLLQEQSGASFFGQPNFSCPAPNKIYLIRATYINGGTGEFALFWAGSALIVSHGSLGPSRPPSKSALVVCLSKMPTAIFSSLSTAL